MGKRAQQKRQEKIEAENRRKDEISARLKEKQPWLYFWRRVDFWILTACFLLVIAFPFVNPYLSRVRSGANKSGNLAVIKTSVGDIKVALYPNDAPKTVDNFIQLSKRGYYNNTTFHRVIRDFVIQGGDPKGDGTGGESAFGAALEDEINPRSLGLSPEQITSLEQEGYRYNYALNSHKLTPGVIAMANSGPNSNGSQFFIVTEKPQPHLDGKHTVFGEVTEGMDIVRLIASVEVGEGDKPKEPITVYTVEIR
jgi:cyclophilin family peptidyl-prolyl cis-trans isomerase